MATILIYNINEPYIHQGGMERVTDSLIRMLQQLGHRVSVLCRYHNRMNAPYQCPCDIHYLPTNESSSSYYEQLLDTVRPDIVIDQEEGGIIGAHGFFRSRNQLRHKEQCYIAVQHSSAGAALRHYRHFKHKAIPNAVLSSLYNGPLMTMRQHLARRRKRRDYTLLNRNYDSIVTLSPSAVTDFLELCPHGDKLSVIANCTHYTPPAAIPPKKKMALYVGRMENRSKGVDKLIRIWARTEADFPDWELHLLGDGPDLKKNKAMAEELGLERCRFHGCCDPEPFYREAAIICLTSYYEGFGMVLLEGMQYGCIPVAFDSYPAVHDLISHMRNGLLVPAFDEKAYARSLASLMNREQLRRVLQQAAKQRAEQFSPERTGQLWQQLISQLLSHRTP